MKYYIDETIEYLIDRFIETKRSIYVYNILLRYFYLNICGGTEDWYRQRIPESVITTLLRIYTEIDRYDYLRANDHTFYYSLDIESNTTIFRHFIEYDWSSWDNKAVLELGCGFGIYTFLFNILKRYYDLDKMRIYSFDFDKWKIRRLENMYQDMGISNNYLIYGDCTDKDTFKSCLGETVVMMYSETISYLSVDTEGYMKIIRTLKDLEEDSLISLGEIFPIDFKIDSDRITHIKINGIYENIVDGFDMDAETLEIKSDIDVRFKKRFGFRWGHFNRKFE